MASRPLTFPATLARNCLKLHQIDPLGIAFSRQWDHLGIKLAMCVPLGGMRGAKAGGLPNLSHRSLDHPIQRFDEVPSRPQKLRRGNEAPFLQSQEGPRRYREIVSRFLGCEKGAGDRLFHRAKNLREVANR